MSEKKLSDAQMLEIIDKAIDDYHGGLDELESAIGALICGRRFGWHGLRIVHSSRTFAKYEKHLGIKFREVLPPRTDQSTRLNGIRIADKLGKFWQVISGGLVPAGEAKKLKRAVT